MIYSGENIFERFTNDMLNEQESARILGGKGRPKSRDRDIYDLDDDDED